MIKEHVVGNSENPEYLFVYPTLMDFDVICSAVERLPIDLEKTACVPYVLSEIYETSIRAEHKKEYLPALLALIEELKPKVFVTFGEVLFKVFQQDKHDNLRKSHGTFFYYNENSRWFPTYYYPVPEWDSGFYDKSGSIVFDLKERLIIDIDAIEPPVYEGHDNNFDLNKIASYKWYVDIETTGLNKFEDKILLLGIGTDNDNVVHIFPKPSPELIEQFFTVALTQNIELVLHNAKFDLGFLVANRPVYNRQVPIFKHVHDTQHYADVLGEPNKGLKHLANKYLMRLGNDAYKGDEGISSYLYLAEDVYTTKHLFYHFVNDVPDYFYTAISNMTLWLLQIEMNGFHLNQEYIRSLEKEIHQNLAQLHNKMVALSGKENFNPNSGDQLGDILVERGVKLVNQTPTGKWVTSKSELTKYAGQDELLDTYLESTKWESLNKNIVKKFGKFDDYIYSTFNINGTDTGRLSSKNENLQNISKSKESLSCFTSRFDNGYILEIDGKQAELVVAALISGDKKFAELLATSDGHSAIGSIIFEKEINKHDNPDERQIAKGISFGGIYGGTAKGLYHNLVQGYGYKGSQKQIEKVLNNFYATFKGLTLWHTAVKQQADMRKRTESPLGRKYNFIYSTQKSRPKDLSSWKMRMEIQRAAMNYMVQGTSADLLAHIGFYAWKAMVERGLRAVMVNTVHDSIILDIPEDEFDDVMDCLTIGVKSLNDIEWLQNNEVYKVLPFSCEISYGRTWYETKKQPIDEILINSWDVDNE